MLSNHVLQTVVSFCEFLSKGFYCVALCGRVCFFVCFVLVRVLFFWDFKSQWLPCGGCYACCLKCFARLLFFFSLCVCLILARTDLLYSCLFFFCIGGGIICVCSNISYSLFSFNFFLSIVKFRFRYAFTFKWPS